MRAAGTMVAGYAEGRLARMLALAALGLAVAVFAYRVVHDLELRGLSLGAQSWALVDFAEQIYGPERSFLEGKNPYRGYPVPNSFAGYAPHTLLVHLPFGLASFDTAASAYAATVILLTVALAWVALRAAGERPTLATTAGLGALLLVSRPGQMNAINGNITAQVVLGAYAALVCAHRRTALAATGLVVALILPPAGGVAGLVASVRHGVEAFRLARETNPVSGWMRIDALAVLGKLAGRPLPAPVEAAVSLAILGAGLIGVRRFLAAGGAAEAPVVTALICLTIAVFTYQQAYGALLLVLPMLALERDAPPLVGARRLVVVGLMAVPFANYLSTYTVLEHLGVHGWKFLVLTSANGVALVVAWTVVLVAALRAGLPGQR